LVAEYPAFGAANTPNIEYGYRGGELLIEGGCDAVRWRVTDHLGSTRMSVGTSGSLASVKRTDYLPFGEEIGVGVGPRTTGQGYSQTDCWRQKFTGYEKDVETGLDYVKARYRSSNQGRFISADPWLPILGGSDHLIAVYANQPQNWNRYTYATNQPLGFIDPDGENPLIVAGAAAGAIIGGGAKYLEFKLSGDKVDWGQVGSAALNGAIQGGVAGATGGASFAVQLSAGVGASIVGGAVERGINSGGDKAKTLEPTELIKDTVSGLVGGELLLKRRQD
jgi:RHS repeat-associated protein